MKMTSDLGEKTMLKKLVKVESQWMENKQTKLSPDRIIESEQKYRILFEEAVNAIFIIAAETGRIVDCNIAAEQLVDRPQQELIGKNNDIIYPKRENERGINEDFKMLDKKAGISIQQTHVITSNGGTRDVIIKSSMFNYGGERFVQSIFHDITESNQIENTLRQERDMLDAVTQNLGAGLVLISRDYHVLWANKSLTSKFNLENKYCFNVLHCGNTICKNCGVKKVFEDNAKIDSHEYCQRNKLGDLVWIELTATPIKDNAGNVIAALELAVPITERKKMENYLKESEESLRTIINATIDAIIVMDDKLNITFWNPSAQRLFGYSKKQIIGKSISSLLSEKDPVIFTIMKEVISKQLKPMDAESIIERTGIKKDGTMFPVEISYASLQINGKFFGVSILRDVTEKKQVQKNLQDYSRKLEETIVIRTDELKEAQSRLLIAERLAAIGELAGMVGHDLRNPLTGIKNAAYYLKKKKNNCTDSDQNQMYEIIDSSIEHANKIINDLLDYSRGITLDYSEVTPKSLVQDSILTIEVPNRIIIIDTVEDRPIINVDKNSMKRLFVNLIKNAIEAMPEKGSLEIKSKQVGENIEFSFTDSGKGIPEDVRTKLFTPLVTTKAQGMGFGLAICKRLVEAHGGKINVTSAVGKGASFVIILPIHPK
jgi:PAS domain S-box-containing protein